MKIFVSYSRRDSGDFAEQIQRHLSSFKYNIFTDVNNIRVGEIWSNTIEENISNCDIFVVIVTDGALLSPHVEREVLQAQRQKKKIIPCFLRGINPNKIKWGLEKIQGVEFNNEFHLARNLYSKIESETNIPKDKHIENIIESTSKTVEDVKTDRMSTTKSDVSKLEQKKKDPQLIPKRRIGALGGGVPYVPSKTADVEKTTTKPDADKQTQKKEDVQPIPKVVKDDKASLEPSRNIPEVTSKKESIKSKENNNGKPSQDIFGSVPKTLGETKTPAQTTIKSDTKDIHQNKGTLIPSKTSIGTIGSSDRLPSTPKYTSPKYENNERYTDRDNNSRQSQGFNLKLIIIPIIAVAIIGVIIGTSYFNSAPPTAPKPITPPDTTTDTITPPDTTTETITPPDTTTETITPPDTTTETYQFIKAWGSEGTGDGELADPRDITVDSSSGNVYVADQNNNRIQKFDTNGNFIAKWGSAGTGDGEFNFPVGIAVDPSTGNVYVADQNNNRIQKFDTNGNFITKWGSEGTVDGEFRNPSGISVDSVGNVYIIDFNQRIQKFDSNGNFITKWGSYGFIDGRFSNVNGISVDYNSDYVYASDSNHNRIQKFDENGKFITKWGSAGTGDGEFRNPSGISVDSVGNVYVSDTDNNRIQVFVPTT